MIIHIETAILLNDILGLGLPSEYILQLETRTEGWVTGLRMAALSMHKRSDLQGFIQGFTGSHRFVFDYLVDEVFERLPLEIREFLLQTSILDRMCSPLCDFVRNKSDSQHILDRLDKMNLFVVSLDDQRSWYRYHHLFAELLRQLLKQTYSEQKPELHQKAIKWYQSNGLIVEAIHYGIAKGDMEQVADLIENNISGILASRDLTSLARWLESVPDTVVNSRPWLNIAYAHVLTETGIPENIAQCIHNAEISLENNLGLEAEQEKYIRGYIYWFNVK